MSIRVLVFASLLLAAPAAAQPSSAQADGVAALLGRLEQVVKSGNRDAYLQLLSQTADRSAATQFAVLSLPRNGAARAVIRERDRSELAGTLPGQGYTLLVEVFFEIGQRARLATWRLDVRRRPDAAGGSGGEWAIADQENLTSIAGLYRLSLNPGRQFAAHDLVVTAEDLQLTLESGSVFVAEADGNITALVLLGKGEMSFSPAPKVERGQVKMFAGSESLVSPFDAALVRLNPFDVDQHINRKALTERPVDPKEMKRADEVFRQEGGKTFSLDLGELSSETWSLLPSTGDFVAEVHTRRFDSLTYARSSGEIEDISLFDRRNRHNISLYASKEHQKEYGRFFSEDEQSDYAVLDYDIDVAFNPARRAIDGRARLSLITRSRTGANSLSLRLADSLNVRSVYSNLFGRLLFVRVRNQNSIVLNLPSTVTAGVPMTLTIEYSGVLDPQQIDSEGIWPQQGPVIVDEASEQPLDESYLYSNRSYWYPQPGLASYSTATIRVRVPQGYGCAASGDPTGISEAPAARRGDEAMRQFTFTATQPLRYLAFLVTKLHEVKADRVRLASVVAPAAPVRLSGAFYDEVELIAKANSRLDGRARNLSKTGADIIRFYTSIVGDCPYPTVTLALVERRLPGGHSPAYLSVLAQPAPGSRLSFRDDPASFPDFPEFFIAHELAHQWWGQAIGWKNYHEQWLSEGFAQYFAALYAEHARGPAVFDNVMRRMRRWTLDESEEGPIYLGYRIGHIKGDSRLFRAVVYNKGATVLALLRSLVGDRAFFAGIRRFYDLWRFEKAGSDDLRQAMEATSGIPLGRFFEQWVYGQALPQLSFGWRVEGHNGDGHEAILRFEQAGEPFQLPVTVLIEYTDKPPTRLVFKLSDRVQEMRVPLTGTPRRIDIVRDETVAVIK